MSFDAQRIYDLLPAIYRLRDAERGGPLAALLGVIASEVAVLEEDLEQLYDDQFIETCAPWVVPYLGDVIGHRQLHGVAPRVGSGRAEVAHAIGYRRRKGTAAMLEQLARDVTGWNARVVEFFELLATTQAMNHLRPNNSYAPDLRQWEPLERLNSALESTPHTIDVRNIAVGDGKYNIPNIGILLWRLSAFALTGSPATKLNGDAADRRYLFSPLGNDTPLFTRPETEDEVSHLAEAINVPEPISRRVLSARCSDYYGPQKSFSLRNGGQEVPLDQIIVCNLADDAGGDWAHHPPENDPATGKVARIGVDPILGRIAFPASLAPDQPHVSFHYGFSAPLGGGEYPRADSFDSELQSSGGLVRVPADKPTIAEAWNALGTNSGIVEITDSGRHRLATPIKLADKQRLEIRAANNCRPLVVLSAGVAISGGIDAEVLLNGLLIAGQELRVPALDNHLSQLRLCHCTLVPGLGLKLDGQPQQPGVPSLVVESGDVTLEIDRCIVGSLRVVRTAAVRIQDSIVDATAETELAYAGENDGQLGAPLEVINSTIFGRVHTAALELASNTLFMARELTGQPLAEPVFSEKRQSGCVRFSFLPAGSRVPRRFRCQPELAIEQALADAGRGVGSLSGMSRKQLAAQIRAGLAPSFTATRYGAPGYAQLRTSAPVEIRTGADDEAEMGAFHQLYQPQRVSNLLLRLNEYLRVGLEAGVFYAT